MRISIIFLLCTIFLIFACKSGKEKQPDCRHLRTGKFEYRSSFSNGRISIERNDSIQIEKDGETGIGMRFKVIWQSACEYHLKFLSFTEKKDSGLRDIDDVPLVRSEILKVTPNYYISRSVADGESIVHIDTILIIK